MPATGVSIAPLVDSAAVFEQSISSRHRRECQAVLRFPVINRTLWFRVVALTHARGTLPEQERRICRFLSYQRIGSRTGRIIGRRGTEELDGGMTLAERYSAVYGLAADAFWVDLRRVRRRGLVEQIVWPAPGRQAGYALVLRYDAIPHDLPEDLARALGVHTLPEAEEPHAGTVYGHLTDVPAVPLAEPVAIPEAGADFDADARWEHPPHTPAALAAEAIDRSARALQKCQRPDLRCTAVATPTPGSRFSDRIKIKSETSPLYAKVFFPSGCSSSDGKWGLSSSNRMEGQKTKTTPSAAPEEASSLYPVDDPRAVADRVLRRAWASWRRQLGRGRVILSSGHWDDAGQWQSSSAWSDLHRTVMIALRRSTSAEVVEVLSANVLQAEDLGRLAAWRLWRLINSRGDRHGYRTATKTDRTAAWWDDLTPDQIRRTGARKTLVAEPLPGMPNPAAERLRDKVRAAAEERRRSVAAKRKAEHDATYARWGITIPAWREPEHIHEQAQAPHLAEEPPRSADESRAAAIQQARASGKRRTAQRPAPSRSNEAQQARDARNVSRLSRYLFPDQSGAE